MTSDAAVPVEGLPAVPSAPPPRALGSRYLLETPLGSGAMGVVWTARDRQTGELRAAKLLREELTADKGIVTRFIQERSILLELLDPHVVRIHDLVVEGSDLAIVMDYIEGEDLRGLLRRQGRLAPSEAVRIVADVLQGLAAAHLKNILHRDVKPDNVLLDQATPPFVRISDFGIARLAQETTVRVTGMLGTADYMAPEVVVSETASPATDVYGAGILLYELLAGHTPFGGSGNGFAVARRHELALPPVLPGLPPALWDVLSGMLAKDPTLRGTAAGVASRLRSLQPALAGLAALPPVPQPTVWTLLDGRIQVADPAPQDAGVYTAPTGPAPGSQSAPLSAPEWQAVGQRADDDPNGTMIRGAQRVTPDASMPVADLTPAVAPDLRSPGPGFEAGPKTELRASRARERPVDTFALEEDEVSTRSRWRHPGVIAAVVVLLLALVGGGVVLVRGSGKGSGNAAAKPSAPAVTQDVTQSQSDPALFSGLTVTRAAKYDQMSQTLQVTVTYQAGKAPLSGPFYEVIPPAANASQCPVPTWGSIQGTAELTPGLASCGWSIPVSSISAQQSVPVTYTIAFPDTGTSLGNDVESRLMAAATQTATNLGQHAGDALYPVQRLTGMTVSVADAKIQSRINVQVFPNFGDEDTQDPLYLPDQRGNALSAQLGGVMSFTAQPTDDCPDGAIGITGNVVSAKQVASGCVVMATLGEATAVSQPFSITSAGS